MQQVPAEPIRDTNLTRNAGCITGPLSAWSEATDLPPTLIQDRIHAEGIEPLANTAVRAHEEKHDRPTGGRAILALKEDDASVLFD